MSVSVEKKTLEPGIPSATLYWLLLSLPTSLLPQWDRLPFWLPIAVLLVCLWRMPPVVRRIRLPGTLVRLILVVAGVAGVFREYHTLIGPDAGVSFLIVLAAMKMLEVRNARDAHVGIVLGYFVLGMNFLFGQTLGLTFFVGMVSVMLTAALLSLHQAGSRRGVWRTLRPALSLFAQAIPVMLVLFVLFPRLPPLWTLSLSGSHARTGLSDSMSPGEIAQLSQSSEVAFRVEFQGDAPPKHQLYWRAVVMDSFDGSAWKLSAWLEDQAGSAVWADSKPPLDWRSQRVSRSDDQPYRYRVIMEPTDRPWLFSLVYGESSTAGVGVTQDFRLIARKPVYSRMEYQVTSDMAAVLDADLSVSDARTNLVLPPQGNNKARNMALAWRQQATSDTAYIDRLLGWFSREKFSYSLEPPLLGEDRIDDFLFNTRTGFCEHYASAFVFMMRAAGIPARVVTGYQGGERGAAGDYLIVRQLDAHAWAEVWLEGRGWVQFDPTSAVAPERVQRGMAQMAERRDVWGNSQAAALKYNSYRWLAGVRQWADYVNYAWYKNVLQYNSEAQDGLMERWLGDRSTYTRILVMAGAVVAILAVISGLLLWGRTRRPLHPADRIYLGVCERMAKKGLVREPGEGAWAYGQRVGVAMPERRQALEAFAATYVRLRYQESDAGKQAELLKRLRSLARQI